MGYKLDFIDSFWIFVYFLLHLPFAITWNIKHDKSLSLFNFNSIIFVSLFTLLLYCYILLHISISISIYYDFFKYYYEKQIYDYRKIP